MVQEEFAYFWFHEIDEQSLKIFDNCTPCMCKSLPIPRFSFVPNYVVFFSASLLSYYQNCDLSEPQIPNFTLLFSFLQRNYTTLFPDIIFGFHLFPQNKHFCNFLFFPAKQFLIFLFSNQSPLIKTFSITVYVSTNFSTTICMKEK